jgi:hypothetical protein
LVDTPELLAKFILITPMLHAPLRLCVKPIFPRKGAKKDAKTQRFVIKTNHAFGV